MKLYILRHVDTSVDSMYACNYSWSEASEIIKNILHWHKVIRRQFLMDIHIHVGQIKDITYEFPSRGCQCYHTEKWISTAGMAGLSNLSFVRVKLSQMRSSTRVKPL